MKQASENIFIEASELEYKINHRTLLQAVGFEIKTGEVFVITGPSGSGKTTLAKIIGGEVKPAGGKLLVKENCHVVFVPQQDEFIATVGLRTSYYGQRYENPNQDGIPTVEDYFRKTVSGFQDEQFQKITDELEIGYVKERKILSLSNGERKRVQLAGALLQAPDLLVLDQPFVGLDVHSVEKLGEITETLKKKGITIVLVCDPFHIPRFADTVLELRKGEVSAIVPRSQYSPGGETGAADAYNSESDFLQELFPENKNYQSVVKMKNNRVSFNGIDVLTDIDWEVKTGERWVLRGPNGAGKTTLLSLITADNPQGYSNNLVLFDRRRGSGESIWDIKRKIGFVSPELHLYFLRQRGIYKPAKGSQTSYNSLTCLDVVLSGLNDEVGFNSSHSDLQLDLGRKWLKIIKMSHLEKSPFLYASLGEQRNILLARALVKTPGLLVLDEPCQGLDTEQTSLFNALLCKICLNSPATLIYVTHRAEEIPSCITHVMELENGFVKKIGKYSKD